MRVHFIENKGNIILYLPDSLKFFRINSITKSTIKDIVNFNEKTLIMEKYKINEDQYNYIKTFITKKENLNYELSKNKECLYKLTLNITNECNLDCKYCYANGGIYNSKESQMSEDTLKKALDVFLDKYRNIENIQLFGGEPTLNLDAIEFVGDYFDKKYNIHKIDFKPIISLVTNGMCSSDRFIDIVNKYNIQLTVSIDGPKCINDRTRLMKNGKGCSDLVINNIFKLKRYTKQPQNAEATFTQYHVNSNIEVSDVIKYIKKNLGIQNIHIVHVSCEKTKDFYLKDRGSFIKSIPEIIENKNKLEYKNTYMIIDRIIRSLISKTTSKYICNAGISTFSVSTKGDIYPCFMLTDVDKYKLGNVLNYSNISNDKLNLFDKSYKSNSLKCKNCFNNTLCHGCIGINYFNTSDAFKTSEEDCQFMKKLTENVILSLCKIS
ncbi:radical SAM/SPASM domain-containing protein [Clostridium pasteurianum]|uniref:Radical SAM additional 4Fe4S-binding domain protein n=1 Tax=Clostridium pasteurianum BC1 TaxID=86416 RepID=R4K240_CLOPA|nr:radical SAM protein [Clostridium pasteurianum]AGK96633.1 radical SAM additional 4Fe4S-binding domain protein [Clostridium pasteurianum BC1]